jgi:flagellar hook protein FlgE
MGSGVSALRTFSKGLEVIGNNIANINTTGFKGSEAKFADSFSNILERSSPSSGDVANVPYTGVGTGVRLAGISTNFTQGSLASTGKTTDLGISGNGFFRVKNATDGQEYATRAGDFRWDDRGYLVTAQGYRVQGLTGGVGAIAAVPAVGAAPAVPAVPAVVPTTIGDVKYGTPPAGEQLQSVSVDRYGSIIEFYSDGSSATTNQVLLQNFNDPSALNKEGNNLYSGLIAAGPIGAVAGSAALLATGANTPGSFGLGTIQSGAIELSNVDLTDQFAQLITMQRSFQAGSRLVTLSDSVLQEIVDLKR